MRVHLWVAECPPNDARPCSSAVASAGFDVRSREGVDQPLLLDRE